MSQMAGSEELKRAGPSRKRTSRGRRTGPRSTPKGGTNGSTCETLEGISLLQVCAQCGLLQGQQAGDFLNRATSSAMRPPPPQDAVPIRGA